MLQPGTRLGPYDIVTALGAGGMGEVYRARDTRLNRDVALKILPDVFASDPTRLARFEREAQLLASLNHPNIAQVYGVEDSSGVRALVMELVDGATLIGRRLPVDEALAVARQIADALEAAHEKGIIHRDLKPGNVMITADGHVKLLDFGLGKSLGAEPSEDPSNSPTVTAMSTQAGVLLGTAAYMSPEQAKGRAADKRSDIWAFGCVLFELLTGRRAFDGEDVTETLAAIVRGEPDWSLLPAGMPPHIRRVLERCLQKDRRLRMRDIGDVLLELDRPDVDRPATTAPPVLAAPTWRRHGLWLGVAVVAAASTMVVTKWSNTAAPALETRLEINTPPPPSGYTNLQSLSPDGRQIAFAAITGGKRLLWLRSLDSTTVRPLAGTEEADAPFWSPDSKTIAFFSGNQLKRLDLAGGLIQTIAAQAQRSPATWGASDVILFKQPGKPEIFRVSGGGGAMAVAVALSSGMTGCSSPQFLADSRRFIFTCAGSENVRGLYLGALDSRDTRRLTDAIPVSQVHPSGWLMFTQQGKLLARRFDAAGGTVGAETVVVAENVLGFTVSASGAIAYRQPWAATRRQFTWFDRTGRALGTLGEVDDALWSPRIAPDGRRVVFHVADSGLSPSKTGGQRAGIWIGDAARATRVTFSVGFYPIWSPDGSRVAFKGAELGQNACVGAKAADGTGNVQVLAAASPAFNCNGPTDWSPDGRFLLVDATSPGNEDVYVLPLTGDRKAFPFVNSPYTERLASFSPDGRWVAYQSHESGRAEIYVRPFPDPGGQWQISKDGGANPRWRRDGKELYWISPDGKLMASAITASGGAIVPSPPAVLFQTRVWMGGADEPQRGQFDVAPDGRFLINTVVEDTPTPPIVLIQNWRPKAN